MNILLTHLHLDFPGGSGTYTVARALLSVAIGRPW